MTTSPSGSKMPAKFDELVSRLPQNCRIKLIGLGGIGCIVLEYLALYLTSLRQGARLVLIDGDQFESGNAARMQFHRLGNKAEVKAEDIVRRLGPTDVAIIPLAEYVTPENIERLIRPGDIVMLCVDNHATRKLVSDHCSGLDEVTLISGGNEGVDPPREWGTYGNVQVALRRDGCDRTVPITRYHPEIDQPEGSLPTDDCGQLAVSTPQILFANLSVAAAMLNALFALACGRLRYQEVALDILQARMLPQLTVEPVGII